MHKQRTRFLTLLLTTAAFIAVAQPGQSADHRDAPSINVDATADINDVYAFVSPDDSTKTVLAMTVNPFTAPGVAAGFSPDVLYQFKIDNTGDSLEDLVIQAVFTEAGPNQRVTVTGPARPVQNRKGNLNFRLTNPVLSTGLANGSVLNGTNGSKVFAGLRDDPFFFDLIYVFRALGLQPGGPVNRSPGVDFFAGMNVSVLAVEVPSTALRGALGTNINVWATTSRGRTTIRANSAAPDVTSQPYTQVDRMARPAINTVLVKSNRKNEFNKGIPSNDRTRFKADAVQILTSINGDAGYSNTIADILLPDVLSFDTASSAGFLNGRRPEDDVIDAVLNVASKGAVTSDGVPVSATKPFLLDFPFFAPPNEPVEPIPPRDGMPGVCTD